MKCEQLKHTSIDSICNSSASRWLKADDINSVYDLVIMSTEDFFQVLNRHRMHPNRTRYELRIKGI
jgi:DNA-directed RNA polymerase alpha subunit